VENYQEYKLADSLLHLLNVTDKLLKGSLAKALQHHGFTITPEQFTILVSLWSSNGQCQYELATCQGKDRASITRLVDGMEKENLVVRIPSEKDRRIKLVYLTQKAKGLQNKLLEVVTKATSEAQHGITPTELATTKKVLTLMIENMNNS
jgi:DNA-binding MarR family transcriptional regulator